MITMKIVINPAAVTPPTTALLSVQVQLLLVDVVSSIYVNCFRNRLFKFVPYKYPLAIPEQIGSTEDHLPSA